MKKLIHVTFFVLLFTTLFGNSIHADDENPELEIDLPSQEIRRPNGAVIKFEIDPFRKKCLLEGLDDIALTLEHSEKIDNYEKAL